MTIITYANSQTIRRVCRDPPLKGTKESHLNYQVARYCTSCNRR